MFELKTQEQNQGDPQYLFHSEGSGRANKSWRAIGTLNLAVKKVNHMNH